MNKQLPYFLSFICCLFSLNLFAQPANDACVDAIVIDSETVEFAFTTIDATTDGPDHPSDCVSSGSTGEVLYNDVWYLYTPDYTGIAEFTTCSMADFDTKIAVYAPESPCPPQDIDLIACNEDGNNCDNFTSYTQFDVEANMTYLLRLGGYGDGPPGETGTGTFTVREFDPIAPPINDDCENATTINGSFTGRVFTTIGATTDGPDHPNDCVSGGTTGEVIWNDVWYNYTPNYTGTAEFTTCNTATYDTKIAVYAPGSPCPPLDGDLVACNDDGDDCAGFTSYVTFDVISGETYKLRIGGWGSGAPGESGFGNFSIREAGSVTPPENDNCVDAIELDLGDDDFVELAFVSTGANTNPPYYSETISCFDVPNGETAVFNDVWYKWTSTFTGFLEWSNCGTSNFDSRMAVYGPDATDCDFDQSAIVGCSDDGIDLAGETCPGFTSRTVFPVEEGGSYIFRLGSFSASASGSGTFIVQRTTPPNIPDNNLCENADTAYIITTEQADNFEVAFLGFTNNATIDGPTPSCQSSGEFLDVFYEFNSGENETLELRFNRVGETHFYLDLFSSCFELPAEGPNFCFDTDGQDQLFSVNIDGFPGVPTDYILRVSSRITSDPAGEFWFQLVGEPFVLDIEELGVRALKFYPNPVSDVANLQFELNQGVSARYEVVNLLGQIVQSKNLGQLNTGEQNMEVDLNQLDAGIYFLRLQLNDEMKTVKFVKE
jgi:hypothetical protein